MEIDITQVKLNCYTITMTLKLILNSLMHLSFIYDKRSLRKMMLWKQDKENNYLNFNKQKIEKNKYIL